MRLDVPIVVSFIYVFLTTNIYGWGILHDKRFIAFSVGLSILYILSELFYTIKKASWVMWSKVLLLLVFIAVGVFTATFHSMYLRNMTSVTGFISDSALQTEIAGRFLLLGKNPYSEAYKNTDLEKWQYFDEVGNTDNPALYHNVTPPFLISLSALGFRIFSQLFGWFDIRVVFLAAYFSLIILAFLKFRWNEQIPLFLALVCLNPMFLNALISGSNDVVVVTMLLWSLFFLEKKTLLVASILLGLSIATKQSAWLATPFYLFYVWSHFQRATFWRFATVAAIMSAIFYVPFAIWNFSDLVNNLIFYVSGSSRSSYPINGLGFGGLLLGIGAVPSIYAYYPFWIWQIGIGIPLTIFILFKQKNLIGSGNMLYSYSAILCVVWFFNRYLTYTHLAFLLIMISASYVWMIKGKKV